jgi:S1-C subfamily serine protease
MMRVLRTLFWTLAILAAFFAVIRLAPVHSSNSGPIWEGPASAASSYTADEQNNIDVYKTSRDATVNITTQQYQRDWFFQPYPVKGAGSGFIVNPEGLILTNNHVVKGSEQLNVTLSDKKSFKATVVGYDPTHDLALVKIDAGRKLPFLHIGDSENLVVGQKVLAIGNPFEFGGTLTTGIVSSLDRTIQTEENRQLEGMIQTDAAINPGNSGGPLLNSHGDVIGINTAIYGSQQGSIGIGFATPINRVKGMLDQFEKTGHVAPPWLGIQTVYVSEDLSQMLELPRKGGLLVQQIERGSPAQEYGLRGPKQMVYVGNYPLGIGGDLIQAVDGKTADSSDVLKRAMDKKRAGDTIELTVYRNGSTQKVSVKLSEAPDR